MLRSCVIAAVLTQLFVISITIVVLARPAHSNAWKLLFTRTDGLPCQHHCQVGPDLSSDTVGEVVCSLGEPDAVYVLADYVMLLYFDGHLLIGARHSAGAAARLDANDAIFVMALTGEPGGFKLAGKGQDWRGFSAIRRYGHSAHGY